MRWLGTGIAIALCLVGAGYLLGRRSRGASKNIVTQPSRSILYQKQLPGLHGKQMLGTCTFQSQGLHFIDQEMLYQIGGAVVYQDHGRNNPQELTKAFSGCVSENFDSSSSKASHSAASCQCIVPTDLLFVGYDGKRTQERNGNRPPRYVEIGADNGKFLSNSYFFDKQLGWEGICVEPNPQTYKQLEQNRPDCHTVNAVVSDESGPSAFEFYAFEDTAWTRQMSGIKGSGPATKDWAAAQAYANEQNTKVAKHQVAAISFAKLFKQQNFDRIELMTVDVEGAEMIVLSTIDFAAVTIHYIVVELNPPVQPWTDLLISKGFAVMDAEGSGGTGTKLLYPNQYDRWFVNTRW